MTQLVTDQIIRTIFISHGFQVKPGDSDLRPYVYRAARGLETAIRTGLGSRLVQVERERAQLAETVTKQVIEIDTRKAVGVEQDKTIERLEHDVKSYRHEIDTLRADLDDARKALETAVRIEKEERQAADTLQRAYEAEQRVGERLDGIITAHGVALGNLSNITAMQCVPGNWNHGPYMHGLANGLLLASATMRGTEYRPLTAPDYWVGQKPTLRQHYRVYRGYGHNPIFAGILSFFAWAD